MIQKKQIFSQLLILIFNRMNKIIIFSLFFAFVFSANFSMAQSYSASCPTEAQAILSATGGCSAIDSTVYANIYNNCCAKVVSSTMVIIYVLVAVLVLALAIWLIFKRKKNKVVTG